AMPYDPRLVAPMRDEMVRMGARELKTVAEVDEVLGDQRGTTLVFVNSVCGCAAGNARPALAVALRHAVRPQQSVTLFAGQHGVPWVPAKTAEGPRAARQYFSESQPSSPSIALFRDGEVVHFVHRHQIEGQSPQTVAANLTGAFDRFCGATV